jgi:hypothetical protein
VEEGHPLGKLFPPPEVLFLPACLAITLAVAFFLLHVGFLIVREALQKG